MIGDVGRFYKAWTVYRMVTADDGMGGFTQTSSSVAAVEGRMRPLTGELKLSADKDTAFGSHRFYCNPTTEITPGRYLSTGGAMYEVKFAADMMSMGRLMQSDCQAVE